MSIEENKAIIRRLNEDVLNARSLDVADEIVATDLVWNSNKVGLEGFKQNFAAIFSAFPDMHWAIEDIIGERAKVVLRGIIRGTQKGEWLNIPPTGKEVALTAIAIFRCADDKIVEMWHNEDDLGLFQQLGVIPPLGESKE